LTLVLIKKLKIPANSIHIYPFFIDNKPIGKKINTNGQNFLFVSEYFLHKNHSRLFEAFNVISKDYPDAKLFITLDETNVRSNEIVVSNRKKNKNIINLGFHPKVDIQKLYGLADCVIFPSLEESFGLGLIEAAQLGLPVLASDLPFVHKVIRPTEVFNPLDINSIEQSMRNFLNGQTTQQTTLLIQDKLNEIIKIISNQAVL
jgi:glycosyltransferase involved in cell wall biosynthesis